MLLLPLTAGRENERDANSSSRSMKLGYVCGGGLCVFSHYSPPPSLTFYEKLPYAKKERKKEEDEEFKYGRGQKKKKKSTLVSAYEKVKCRKCAPLETQVMFGPLPGGAKKALINALRMTPKGG